MVLPFYAYMDIIYINELTKNLCTRVHSTAVALSKRDSHNHVDNAFFEHSFHYKRPKAFRFTMDSMEFSTNIAILLSYANYCLSTQEIIRT